MVNFKTIKHGQARAYQDSVYQYEIETDTTMTEVELVVEIIGKFKAMPSYRLDDLKHHSGTSGFPFGLYEFYSLIQSTPTKWLYTVTKPFCD